MRALLGDVHDTLRARVERASTVPLVRGLAAWFGLGSYPLPPVRPTVWTYQHVARLALAADGEELFEEGLGWLRECRFFRAGVPPGFEADPLAVFAVGIGLSRHPSHPARPWLASLARQALNQERDAFRQAFLLGALRVVGESVEWGPAAPELAVALEGRGFDIRDPGLRERAYASVFESLYSDERAVVQLAVLEFLCARTGDVDLHSPSVEDVVAILRGVPAALKRWPWEDAPKTRKKGGTAQRWDLQVEDHVQALLWAILRPVFTDIDDEEYLVSLGHKHPRPDFVVPSLRLAIEAKFLRKATQGARADVIQQVSADTGLYLHEGTGLDCMVAFVWDETGSVHHHAELEDGLRRLPGVVDAIVVSRPGSWRLETEE